MKPASLIIVESPTKSKTLAKFLGKDFQIEATMGHIRDLPEDTLGIKTDKDFAPSYVTVPGKAKIIRKLKEAAKGAKAIMLATDPDREGEVIAWHTTEILDSKKLPFKRIVFHEITKAAIKKALKAPRKIDMDLVSAQQGRRVLDRLVGYKLSPLLWFKIRRGLSAGRVQSVAVRLICDREAEIEKFVPEEYWEIWAHLKRRLGAKLPDAPVFAAKLVKKNGKTFKIKNKVGAQEAALELKKAGYEVEQVEKKEVKRAPGPPFRTATLAQAASSRFGWSARRTMRAAQSLYEKGLITYHRTDSTFLAGQAVAAARKYIRQTFGETFLPEKPRFYKTTSRVAQEAHEAIRPTRTITKIEGTNDEERLYNFIFKRFIASQAKDAIFDQTQVFVLAVSKRNHFLFEAQGQAVKFLGWLALYDRQETPKDEIQLPELAKGDELVLLKLDPAQKFTKALPRYTEATLIKVLEEYGIGRPSTYAPILSTIQDRHYVEKVEPENGGRRRFFKPTPLGTTVNDFLVEYFPDIVDTSFTANMEEDLDEIANGKKQWVAVVRDFYEPFSQKLKGVSKAAEKVTVPTEATDEICPDCGAPLVIRIGRFGKFLSCSKFPECRFTKPYLEEAGFNCEKCGAPMVVKKTKKGKTFYGCSKWPACDWASWRKPSKKKDEP